jgi:ABC-type sugar transport system permease subunit
MLGGLLLLSPALIILIGLVVYPFTYAIWLGFQEKAVGTAARFVGLANFRYVLAWPQFSTALVNTAMFTITAVAIKFTLGMSIAVVLNQRIRARNFFRAFLLLAGYTIHCRVCSTMPCSTSDSSPAPLPS